MRATPAVAATRQEQAMDPKRMTAEQAEQHGFTLDSDFGYLYESTDEVGVVGMLSACADGVWMLTVVGPTTYGEDSDCWCGNRVFGSEAEGLAFTGNLFDSITHVNDLKRPEYAIDKV
jgi:hypothetical protein